MLHHKTGPFLSVSLRETVADFPGGTFRSNFFSVLSLISMAVDKRAGDGKEREKETWRIYILDIPNLGTSVSLTMYAR